MRVPILFIDDFAASCGKAKTQHEKAWDLFKGAFDTLGTRIAILLGIMIERARASTMLYIQLAEALFKETSDEFTVRVASKPEEIQSLLEVGFEYVCEKDGLMFFRKRK